MTTLVTGGCGCIGSYIVRDLLARGERVVNFDADQNRAILRQVLPAEALEGVVGVRGDVGDFQQVCRVLKEHGAKRIVHLAAMQIPASQADPAAAVRVNVGGLVNVLEAARILPVDSVVWASSIAVFGPPSEYPGGRAGNESHHRPVSVYGATKSLGEQLVRHYAAEYGIRAVGLRFTAVYGVGRERGKSSFTTEMIRRVAAGEPYVVPFGDDRIDWQYVEDVSRLVLTALEARDTPSRIYNTQGDVRAVREAVAYLSRLVPEARLTLDPGRFGIVWELDTEPLRRELGFLPSFTMERGVLTTLNLYRVAAGKPPIRAQAY
jgi:nucleoside-diphosphate-sugar epimerase